MTTAQQGWHPGTGQIVVIIGALAQRTGVAFAIVPPNGRDGDADRRIQAGSAIGAFTLVFHSHAALLSTLTRGHIGLLESYFDQAVDVEGDLGAAFSAELAAGLDLHHRPRITLETRLHEWQHANARAVRAIVYRGLRRTVVLRLGATGRRRPRATSASSQAAARPG